MEETFCAALGASPDELLSFAAKNQSRPNKASLKAAIHRITKKQAADLCSTLLSFAGAQVQAFQNLENAQFEHSDSFKTPSPKHKRRKRACSSPGAGAKSLGQGSANNARRASVSANLKACAMVAHFALSHPQKAFQPCDLFPTIQMLHDQLVFFENDLDLQDTIAMLCEAWWKEHLPGRESLIAQSLPFLLSKSLEVGRKVNVHRVYSMREAFTLFDFVDETIEDLKHLLMRCVLTPAYLRSPDGRRFISFLFNINGQFTKELIVMVKSQIPFGRKSILEAYGEILFRAWRMASGPCLQEIEDSCVQGLIEGSIYASTKTLASSIRKVLVAFTAQRTQEGVEALLFRLQEPILFRSLQVANSNVRRNALLLLIDLFPLENPDATKEENDILLDKQFLFLEKLLVDPCPDVRVTAVEGICRVLRLFWEVVTSGTTVKLLSKVVDETAHDNSSSNVRCAVLQGVTYLLENPASHDLLKALLPRLSPLLADSNLAVRIAMVDMLLAIKGIRAIPFLKVASLETLLSALESDNLPVAKRLTRLLIPSYFPSKVPVVEACNRCVALIMRAPQAGVRFCELAMAEGVSPNSLLELVKGFVALLSSSEGQEEEEQEGIFAALNQLCQSLANRKELKVLLSEVLTRETLKALLSNAATPKSRTSIVQLVSVINPTDVPELFEYCSQIVTNFPTDALSSMNCREARSVHSLMLAWGGFNDLIETLVQFLGQVPVGTQEVGRLSTGRTSAKKNKLESKSPWTKSMKKSHGTGKAKKGAAVSGQQIGLDSLQGALGAAWHIENLVEVEETRNATLAHKSLPALVSGLRNTVYCVLHNSDRETPVSEFLKASSIRAYTTLTVHMTVKENGIKKCSDVTTKNSQLIENDPILRIAKELIEWTENLQKVSLSTTLSSSVKKDDKRARKSQARCREALMDISNSTPCGASSDKISDVEMVLKRVQISNTSLESLLYFLSLKLVNDDTLQDACLEFATKLMHWILGWLRRFEGAETCIKMPGFKVKDLLPCVRTCATHSAKMLYLSLRNNTERAIQFADLANCLLNMLAFSETFFGFKGAMSLSTALKPWIPDLFISIASATTFAANDFAAHTSNCSFDGLVHLGNRFRQPWVDSFAKSAFETTNLEQENEPSSPMAENVHGSQQNSQEPGECSQSAMKADQRILFSVEFLNKTSKLLKRGEPTVLEGICTLFLWYAAVCLNSHDFSGTAGAMDIVSKRTFPLPKKGVSNAFFSELFIATCEEIGKHVDLMLEGSISIPLMEKKFLYTLKDMMQNLLRAQRGS